MSDTVSIIRQIVLDYLDNTVSCGLDRDNPHDFDHLRDVAVDCNHALHFLERAIEFRADELEVLRALIEFHDGFEEGETPVSLSAFERVKAKVTRG